MRVVISGSTGLIGSALMKFLAAAGYQAGRLVRAPHRPGRKDVRWDPTEEWVDADSMEACRAVIHLAGESITRRWTARRRARIRDSRIHGTRALVKAMNRLAHPPAAFICASAIGYYGDCGQASPTEDAPPGTGFLADLCRDWEEIAASAAQRGVRVVNLRLGLVLARRGGALKKMLLPFRLCLGGRIGSGQQYWSWVALEDVLLAVRHVIENTEISGPINVVAPHPVTNREFAKTLGRVLRRPACLPLPAFLARFLVGRAAREVLLTSIRAEPHKLLQSGFQFQYPQLEAALKHVLGREPVEQPEADIEQPPPDSP